MSRTAATHDCSVDSPGGALAAGRIFGDNGSWLSVRECHNGFR
jgi:hypothetical protein